MSYSVRLRRCSFYCDGQCESLDGWEEQQIQILALFVSSKQPESGESIGLDVSAMKAKKMLLALVVGVMGLLPLSSAAQSFNWEMSPKYVGEIHAGYKTTTSVAGVKAYSAMAELGTLQGVSLNEYLDLAIGVDAFMMTHYYSGRGLRFGMNTYFDMRPAYPINDRFKVFLDLGLGGFFSVHSDPSMGSGFFCQFGPGIRYRKLSLALGMQSFGTGSGCTGFFTKLGLYF